MGYETNRDFCSGYLLLLGKIQNILAKGQKAMHPQVYLPAIGRMGSEIWRPIRRY